MNVDTGALRSRGGDSGGGATDQAILRPYLGLLDYLRAPQFRDWRDLLVPAILKSLGGQTHGDVARWRGLIGQLPEGCADYCHFNESSVRLEGQLDAKELETLLAVLEGLHPWRKGPFDLFGIQVDTEWRSDLKWDRLAHAIAPLAGRLVLDVGCGSGYHAWRMMGAGASRVIGIDPTLLSVHQFLAVKRLAGDLAVDVLPIGIDEVPRSLGVFDTVFSMGVLYHRRSPIDHLLELQGLLRPQGELVLETLVIEGSGGEVLIPRDRYAQMRNVWFIPTPDTLRFWLERTGFERIRLLDVSVTSVEEQRSTPWMRFHSLTDFLQPDNPAKTLEGYPAPRRAIFLAEAPRLP